MLPSVHIIHCKCTYFWAWVHACEYFTVQFRDKTFLKKCGVFITYTHYVTCSMCLNSLIWRWLTVEVTIKCAPCLLCWIGDDCQICSTLHSHRQQTGIMWIQNTSFFMSPLKDTLACSSVWKFSLYCLLARPPVAHGEFLCVSSVGVKMADFWDHDTL